MKNELTLDLVKRSLLNSSLMLSQKVYKVFATSLEKQIDINFHLKLEDYNNLEMGFGLKAGQTIVQNQQIFKIPITTGLNGLDLIDFKEDISKKVLIEQCWKVAKKLYPDYLKTRQEKSFQNQMLSWQIILNHQHKEAYNNDLVEAFPENDLAQPLYASDKTFNLISSKNLKKYYCDCKNFIQTIYNEITKEKVYELSLDMFAWAYNNTLSRKMSLIDPMTGNPYEIIVPIVDFINHSSTKANCYVEPIFDSTNQRSFISVYSSKLIRENEQLFFDYGPMNNKKFMNMFGFFDVDNPTVNSDFIVIEESSFLKTFLEISESEILNEFYKKIESNKEFKMQLLTKNSIEFELFYPQYNVNLFPNKFDTELLKFLRIIFLEDEEINKMKNTLWDYDFTSMFTKENEQKVVNYLLTILVQHHYFVRELNHSDLIECLGKIDSIEKYKTKCMYRLEAEEKNLLEKNINWLLNKRKSLL